MERLLLRRVVVEALEIGACLRVLRIDREGVFEVAACCCGLAGLRLEDAEVAPAVGVFCTDAESGLLLGDRASQIAACSEHLCEQGMAGWVRWIGGDGGVESGFCFGGVAGLLISEGQLLICRGVACAGGDGPVKQLLRVLRIVVG